MQKSNVFFIYLIKNVQVISSLLGMCNTEQHTQIATVKVQNKKHYFLLQTFLHHCQF